MAQLLARKDIEAQLAAKREEIDLRMQGLRHEIATTGEAVKATIFEHPFAGTAGSLLAGVATGLVFGGRRKSERRKRGKDHPDVPAAHRALVDDYIDAVAREAHQAGRKGASTRAAVRQALDGRVPLIAYAGTQHQEGFFKQGFDLAVKTALGFGIRAGLDYATTWLGIPSADGLARAQRDDEGEGAAEVAAAVSEET